MYRHLRFANILLPTERKEKLQGLYLRHRHANRVRLAVLAYILAAFQRANIRAVLLKTLPYGRCCEQQVTMLY